MNCISESIDYSCIERTKFYEAHAPPSFTTAGNAAASSFGVRPSADSFDVQTAAQQATMPECSHELRSWCDSRGFTMRDVKQGTLVYGQNILHKIFDAAKTERSDGLFEEMKSIVPQSAFSQVAEAPAKIQGWHPLEKLANNAAKGKGTDEGEKKMWTAIAEMSINLDTKGKIWCPQSWKLI